MTTSIGPAFTAVPVDIITGPWEVWTELVVPLFGASAATAVAIVAVWATFRLAKIERDASERDRRLVRQEHEMQLRVDWVLAVDRGLADIGDELTLGSDTHLDASYAKSPSTIEGWLKLQTTAMPIEGIEEPRAWMAAEVGRLSQVLITGANRSRAVSVMVVIRRRISGVLMEWARTGKWIEPSLLPTYDPDEIHERVRGRANDGQDPD